jgi:type I restriction enzyme M protein
MANEELHQRGLLLNGELKGVSYGRYEDINVGSTNIKTLISVGLGANVPEKIDFPFEVYVPPKTPASAKPDRIFALRKPDGLSGVAVAEHKAPKKLRGNERLRLTSEQGLYSAIALGAKVAIATDGTHDFYIDVAASIADKKIVYLDEKRSLNPSVLDDLLAGEIVTRDPSELAERVWQHIWHATKDEPKQCLLTFVELFVLKFLSDNLADKYLPKRYKF